MCIALFSLGNEHKIKGMYVFFYALTFSCPVVEYGAFLFHAILHDKKII